MNLKVSYIRDVENISKIIEMFNPLYLAFDFRSTSSRYMGELDEAILTKIPHKIHKIAIFDNPEPLYISYITGKFALNGAQIQANVPIQTCEILAAEGLEIIKTITSISDIDKYEGLCNAFIFEKLEIFEKYRGNTPVILSSDIYRPSNSVIAVDTCENFEVREALKDCQQIENWKKDII